MREGFWRRAGWLLCAGAADTLLLVALAMAWAAEAPLAGAERLARFANRLADGPRERRVARVIAAYEFRRSMRKKPPAPGQAPWASRYWRRDRA